MSVSFLPIPMKGIRRWWGSDTSQAVTILGYEATEAEWLVILPSGEVGWIDTQLIRFDEAES